MKQAPTGLVACCNSFLECFVAIFLASRCSLFLSPHPSNRVSFSFRLKSFGSSPFRAPARASMVVHGPAFVSFPIRSIYCFELGPGFHLAPFRKNVTEVVRSSPRPLCLGPVTRKFIRALFRSAAFEIENLYLCAFFLHWKIFDFLLKNQVVIAQWLAWQLATVVVPESNPGKGIY